MDGGAIPQASDMVDDKQGRSGHSQESGTGSGLAGKPGGAGPSAGLSSKHDKAIRAADMIAGGAATYLFGLAVATWLTGESSARAPLVILVALLVNLAVSQISVRVDRPYAIEVGRTVLGGMVVPAAYLLVDGPMYPWWPGGVIMTMACVVLLGLLTQRAFWGQLLSVYYIVLLGAATWLWMPDPNWYDFAVRMGVLAVVGLMFSQVMALLGRSIVDEQARSGELAAARDALFSEMEVAQEIQTLLLPKQPCVPENEVEGRMVPASEVGGDYYDVIETGERGVFLAIGDVSGHGVTSGLTMMMARASLMGALESSPTGTLPELYCVLNGALCKNLIRMDMQLYMTFALLEYKGGGRFEAVGRHLPLLVYRSQDDSIEEVELQGMWLGVVQDLGPEHVPITTIHLERGDLLFMYTDGVVEHFSADGEMFGFERLKDIVRANGMQGGKRVVQAMLAALERHSGEQEDDVTMLAVNHTGVMEAAASTTRA